VAAVGPAGGPAGEGVVLVDACPAAPWGDARIGADGHATGNA